MIDLGQIPTTFPREAVLQLKLHLLQSAKAFDIKVFAEYSGFEDDALAAARRGVEKYVHDLTISIRSELTRYEIIRTVPTGHRLSTDAEVKDLLNLFFLEMAKETEWCNSGDPHSWLWVVKLHTDTFPITVLDYIYAMAQERIVSTHENLCFASCSEVWRFRSSANSQETDRHYFLVTTDRLLELCQQWSENKSF